MLQAATHLDEGRDDPLEVATAKFWAAEGGNRIAPRRAAHPRRHQHRRRLPDPPLLPVAEAVRVHPRLRHPRAAADRQGPRRHPRLTKPRTGVSCRCMPATHAGSIALGTCGHCGEHEGVEEASDADVIAASLDQPARVRRDLRPARDRRCTATSCAGSGPYEAEAMVGEVFRIAFEKRRTYDVSRSERPAVAVRDRDQPAGQAPAGRGAAHPRRRPARRAAIAGDRPRRRRERRRRRRLALAARGRCGRRRCPSPSATRCSCTCGRGSATTTSPTRSASRSARFGRACTGRVDDSANSRAERERTRRTPRAGILEGSGRERRLRSAPAAATRSRRAGRPGRPGGLLPSEGAVHVRPSITTTWTRRPSRLPTSIPASPTETSSPPSTTSTARLPVRRRTAKRAWSATASTSAGCASAAAW